MTTSSADNSNLNLNPARGDKFFLSFGNIPSLVLLSPEELTSFQADLLQTEEKNYFHLSVRSAELPSMSLGENRVDTMFGSVAETSLKYEFQNFTTEIRMDNNFLIYKMLVLWMFLMNDPEGFNQFASQKTFDKTTSTAILTIKDNFLNSVISFEFYDLRPIGLSSVPLSFINEGEEIVLSVTWQYTYFMPRKATGEAYSLVLPNI